MKKILLAYDGGEPAKRALDQVVELAKVLQGSVSEHVATHAHTTVVVAR